MHVTVELLQRAAGCPRGVALTWASPLHEACRLYGIDTPARFAAFIAQVAHESAGLTRTTENLNYSAEGLRRIWPSRYTETLAIAHARSPSAIANHVYGGRLGNKAPGDGFKYRGRGLLQVTGRANYEAVRDLLRERLGKAVPDFEQLPDALAEPKWAALSAAAYWVDRGLNDLADAGNFNGITRKVNGGTNGHADRVMRYGRAKRALQGIA